MGRSLSRGGECDELARVLVLIMQFLKGVDLICPDDAFLG